MGNCLTCHPKHAHERVRSTSFFHDDTISSRHDSCDSDVFAPPPTSGKLGSSQWVALCGKQDLFREMPPEALKLVAGSMKKQSFSRNAVVIKQGDVITESSMMYIVLKGSVTIHVYGSKPFDIDLGVGDMFGELAVLFKQARNATVISKGCQLLGMSRISLKKHIAAMPFAKNLLFLRVQILLQNLSDLELFQFARHVTMCTYPSGHLLTVQDEPGHQMFMIRSGHVDIIINKAKVATLGRGSVVGQRALHGKLRTATCVTVSRCLVAVIDEDVVSNVSDPVFRRILSCDAVMAVQQHSRVFGSFTQQEFSTLLKTIEETTFQRGECLFSRGEAMNELYVIQRGEVEGSAVCFAGGFQYCGSITGNASVSDVVVMSPNAVAVKCSRHRWQQMLEIKNDKSSITLEQLQLYQEIGAGTSGKVYLACSREDKTKMYAVKAIPKRASKCKSALQECSLMKSINSRFCVKLYSVDEDASTYYLVMELVHGGELFHHLQMRGKFTQKQTKFYLACVILALEYLHVNGIVYRDLKPENLLMDGEGYIKMADFGFAKQLHNRRAYTICGTPEYQAPEIMIAHVGTTTSADYWSLGVLMYEMLTGLSPFLPQTSKTGDPWVIIRNAQAARYNPPPGYVDTHAHDLIVHLLQPDPAERLTSPSKIKQHPWFRDFDWRALNERRMPAPFKPHKAHAVERRCT